MFYKQEKKMKNWTAEEIKHKLETDQKWLERAIVAIYNKQTADEKNSEETKYHNGVGFSGADAHLLTYCAHWILSGKSLSGKYLALAKKKMVKYAKQLETISKEKVTPEQSQGAITKAIHEMATKQNIAYDNEIADNAKKVAEVINSKPITPSYLVTEFSIQKSQDGEGHVITTFVQEASSLEGFNDQHFIRIQGKEFELTHRDRNQDRVVEGWNYKSKDDFYALIIND
jgi:hypothetical protein